MKLRKGFKATISLLLGAAVLLASLAFVPAGQAQQAVCGNTYTVQRGDSLSEIAALCSTSVTALLRANPAIVDADLIFPGQVLAIPGAIIPGTGGGTATYIIERGDTLSEIAAAFNVSLAALLQANPQIENPRLIFPGQSLVIPSGAVIPDTGADPDTYIVQRGDTLSEIAAAFNISLAALLQANPQIENPRLIFPGQVVNLPSGAVIPGTGDGPSSYVVQRSDTLREIANRFGTTVNRLLQLNPGIQNPDLIFAGQTILVP